MAKRKLILVDYLTGGHHATYITEIVKVLDESKEDFHVLYPKLTELDKSFSNHYTKYRSFWMNLFKNSPRFKTVAIWFDLIWNLYKIGGRSKNNVVFITWVDTLRLHGDHPLVLNSFIKLVKVFGPHNWIGLYFHPTHLRKSSQGETESMATDSIFKMNSCKAIAVLDKGVGEKLHKLISKPIIIFPDITNTLHNDATSKLGLEILEKAKGRRVISILGMQSRRKGVLSLIEIAKDCVNENVFFLFGGPLDEPTYSERELSSLLQFIASKPKNCFFWLQHLKDGPEFNDLIKLSSLIYAVYLSFPHSSNLLVKAAFFGKPVLVSNEYYMGELVDKYQLGDTVNPNNLLEIKEKIINYNYLCINDKLQRKFFKLNAKEKLKETFQGILKMK
tara:strand:+ start:4548 stop:5717 length:1170 start_codon:yes stop_codon:yes gene_type:complete